MLNKKLTILMILLVGLLAVSAASAADNDTSDAVGIEETTDEVVSIENDQEILEGNNVGTFTDLANDIANAGSQLNLTRSYNYNQSTDSEYYKSGINIDKSIIINGNGHTINANNQASIFRIHASDVALNDINFIEGRATMETDLWRGGAIEWSGDNGVLTNCNFEGCRAENDGGAIYWIGANGISSDCCFISCSGPTRGGGICFTGANCSLVNGYFKDSNGYYDEGNGWFSYEPLTVIDTKTSTDVQVQGGGMTNYGVSKKLTATLRDADNNVLAGEHVFITLNDEEYELITNSNGQVSFSTPRTLAIGDYVVTISYKGNSTHKRSFTATKVYVRSPDYNATLKDLTNEISLSGDRLDLDRDYTFTEGDYSIYYYTRKNIVINGNGHTIDGKNQFGFILSGQNFVLSNIRFVNLGHGWNNGISWQADNGIVVNCSFINCYSTESGGAIHFYDNNCSIINSTFINCSSEGYGGAIYFGGYNCNLINSTFKGNAAPNGLDIYSENSLNTINITADKASTAILVDDWWDMVITLMDVNNNELLTGKQISISINNNSYNKTTDSKGQVSLILSPDILEVGEYDAIISYKGTSEYYPSRVATRVYVNPMSTHISAKHDDKNMKLTATLTADDGRTLSGVNLVVSLDGEEYTIKTNSKGQATLSTANLTSGRHTATISYNGNETYYPTTRNINIYVNDEDSTRTLIDLDYDIANANGQFNLTRNYTYDEECDNELDRINIEKSITINGNGFTINGTGYYGMIFNIRADNVSIKDINFMNTEGYSIYSDGANALELSSCNFVNTTVEYYYGCNFAVSDCSFVNTRLRMYSVVDSTVSNCIFMNCNGYMSPICWDWDSSNGVLSDCTFVNCFAAEGGGVYWRGNNGTLVNCSFIDCLADNGGAIYWPGNDGSIIDSTFINCYAEQCGGGIYFSGEGCSLVYPSFEGCSAQDGSDWYNTQPIIIIDDSKTTTVLSAPDVTTTYGLSKNLNVTLKDINNNVLAGEEISIVFNNVEYTLITNSKGQASLAIPKNLNPKTYKATVSYAGNDDYKSATKTVNVIVNKANTIISAQDVSIVYKNTTGKLVATITNEYGRALAVNLNINFNGETYTEKADSKGQVTIPIGTLSPGTYTATVSYAGNVNYKASSTTAKITVAKADTRISAPNVSVNYSDPDGKLVATITNAYGKALAVYVNVTINGETYTVKANSKGQITVPTDELTPKKYTVTISYSGNGNYNPSSTTAKITVKKTNTIMTAPNVSVNFSDPDGKLVATLTNAYGKALAVYVNVTFNGETYAVRADSNGQVIIPTDDLTPKTYTATISYKGNGNYYASTATAKITVKKADTVMTAPNVSVNYSNPDGKLVATLTNAYGKALAVYVNVTFNGETYAVRANSKGQVIIPTDDLTPKTYTATISYKGNGNYKPSSVTAKVIVTKADSVITAPDVSVAYKDTSDKTIATITNPYGKALAVYVNVTVNGVKYVLRANSKGQVSVSTANLAPGTYNATISYKGNGNYKSSTATTQITVNKADTVIAAPDVSVAYKDTNGKLVATITNAYGKALSVYVNVNINGVDYAVRADSKGQITVSTADLAPGTYTATITYNGNGNYNPTSTTAQVTVNKADTVITAQSVTVDCGDPNGKLVATLTNAYGKALSVYVNVNLNGETYALRADSQGKINIPTKDLASGNYTATITYAGNGNYNPTNTTANIIVKQ